MSYWHTWLVVEVLLVMLMSLCGLCCPRIVCHFHTNAVRESANMSAQCFRSCNYARCLEIDEFSNMCKR